MNWLQHKPHAFEYSGPWVRNWFSNFVTCNIVIDGLIWPSVENYYQAMKTTDPQKQSSIRCMTPQQAKKAGRAILIRDDWNQNKEKVMMRALEAKFSQPEWQQKLLATGDAPIIEWNNWRDQIWGVTLDGQGENKLGLLLMKLRNRLQAGDLQPIDKRTPHSLGKQ